MVAVIHLKGLTAAQEAALVGRSPQAVSKARTDPAHPINGPHGVMFADRRGAPEAEIREFWKGRRRGRRRVRPELPPGMTRDQYRGLRRITEGQPVTSRMVRVLTRGGWLDDTGQPTDQAREALAHHTDGEAP